MFAVRQTELVLHDLGQAKEEKAVAVETEKLPVAFRLMSMQSGTPMKIFKNLRACSACHAVLKLLWKITGGKVVFSNILIETGSMGAALVGITGDG